MTVGSDSPPIVRHRGRTYWVRETLSPLPPEEKLAPTPPKKPTGKRFVEPYRLSAEQRTAIITALAEQEIGDDEGRALFTAALEYDLAGCPGLNESTPAPPRPRRPRPSAADKAVAEVAGAARALAEQLGQLDPAAVLQLQSALKDADRFRRTYGDDYLRSLRCELDRVAAAVARPSPAPAPEKSRPEVPEAARRFILRAADAFADCFETRATAQRGSPFLAALKAVAAATGVRIPLDQRTVAEIIGRG